MLWQAGGTDLRRDTQSPAAGHSATGRIQPIPRTYRGTKFRSTLEADWAATFDTFGWHWKYEPEGLLVDGLPYLCDFYLPTQRVWCEVKGPHNERMEKTHALGRALGTDAWDITTPLLVVLRAPGPGDACDWHGIHPDQDIYLATCPSCQHHCFLDYSGLWACRRGCLNSNNKFWSQPGGAIYAADEVQFTRARDVEPLPK